MLVSALVASACAHTTASTAPFSASTLANARESVRQDSRIASLEAKLTTLEARLQAVQAQVRAQRDVLPSQRSLTYERWQPGALEHLTDSQERSIEGQGDAIKLSVQRSRKEAP